jgi:DNA-directed RNA polymerase subunit RPC12/RpoP/predicted Zn-ribbon and HTH transcriptional regulator
MEILAESKAHILIRCPQCGGTIDFLEEAQVIRCHFCNSSLLVAGREGVLRYVLPPQLSDPQKAKLKAMEYMLGLKKRSPRAGRTFLFYAPFWRMQGTVFRWVFGSKLMKDPMHRWGISLSLSISAWPRDEEATVNAPPPKERGKALLSRVLDHTLPGYGGLELGLHTIGIRAQVLRLQPFTREHLEMRESFLPLEVSLEKAQADEKWFSNLFFEDKDWIPEVVLHRIVGNSFSVIYFPLWYVECQHESGGEVIIIDAVAQRPIQTIPDGSDILNKLRRDESRKSFQFSELRFLPFRCPNCGWEFPFRPLSRLHFCPTCRRLFREDGGEWVEHRYWVIPAPDKTPLEKLLWVPFWRCKAVLESNGERLENMAALYRLAPPPRAVNRERESRRPIYFYLPATKFRYSHLIHNLGSRLTFVQPDVELGSFADGSHPLTAGGSLPEGDAREMGVVILGSMIPQGSPKARAWIKNCQVDLQDPQILYFPFSRVDLFWKELNTGISFQHNAPSEDLPEPQR